MLPRSRAAAMKRGAAKAASRSRARARARMGGNDPFFPVVTSARSRSRRGGDPDPDLEEGWAEQKKQDDRELDQQLSDAEEGRSVSPSNMPQYSDSSMSQMEKGNAFKESKEKYYNPDADNLVGGRRRRRRKRTKRGGTDESLEQDEDLELNNQSVNINTMKLGGKRRSKRRRGKGKRSRKAGFGEVPGQGLQMQSHVRVFTGKPGENQNDPSTWEPDYIITKLNESSKTATVCKLDSVGACLSDVGFNRIKKRGMLGTTINNARVASWQMGTTSVPTATRGGKKFYKGKASATRKGRKDFETHKGDKYFHRKGHRETTRKQKKGLFNKLFGI